MAEPTVMINASIPKRLKDMMKEEKEKDGKTITWIVAKALDDYYKAKAESKVE